MDHFWGFLARPQPAGRNLAVICPREGANVVPAKKCKSPLVSRHFWAYDGTVFWGFLVVICPREVVNGVLAKNENHN